MCAVINSIKLRAATRKITGHPLVHCLHHLFREVSARDSSLIGDDDSEPTVGIQYLDGVGGVRKSAKARSVVNVTDFLGNRAVAIDENRSPHFSCPANFSFLIASESVVASDDTR